MEGSSVPWSKLPDPDDDGPPPAALPELLDQVLAGLGAPGVDAVVAIHDRWADIVGSEVTAHARPVAVDHATLTIVVDNPAWASHVRWSEPELLRRMDAVVGVGVVERLVVRVVPR